MSVLDIDGETFAIATVPKELFDRFKRSKVMLQVEQTDEGYQLIPNDDEGTAYQAAESLLFEKVKSTLFMDETADQPEGVVASVGALQVKEIDEATVLEKDNWAEMTDDERSAAIGAFELDVVVHPSIVRDFNIERLQWADVPVSVAADKKWLTKVRVDIKKRATPTVVLKSPNNFYGSSFQRQVFLHALPEINAKISDIWPIIETNQRFRDARRQAPATSKKPPSVEQSAKQQEQDKSVEQKDTVKSDQKVAEMPDQKTANGHEPKSVGNTYDQKVAGQQDSKEQKESESRIGKSVQKCEDQKAASAGGYGNQEREARNAKIALEVKQKQEQERVAVQTSTQDLEHQKRKM